MPVKKSGIDLALAFVLTFATAGAKPADASPATGGDDGYTMRVEPPEATAVVGARGALSLAIAPKPGYRIDLRGPLLVVLSVTPDTGLILPRRRYFRRHAADERAEAPRFDLRYIAERAGGYRVAIRARFWLCRRHTCWPVVRNREVAITVSAATSPDAGPTAVERVRGFARPWPLIEGRREKFR